jgi:hypothetical protein
MEIPKPGSLIYSEYALKHGRDPVLLYIDKVDEYMFYYTGYNFRSRKTFKNDMEHGVLKIWENGRVFVVFDNKKAAQKYINLLGYDFEIPG